MSKKKRKKQKLISKIIADGRVTKKEAKKASKKGISLARIEKAQTKSFKPGNVFSKSTSKSNAREVAKGTSKASEKTAYSPLVIQGKAQKVFDKGSTTAAATTPQQATTQQSVETTVDPMLQELMDQNDLLQQQLDALPDFESIFAQQAEEAAAARQADLDALRQEQALALEELAARQAEQERRRLLTAQTQQSNMARSSLTPDFSIGGRARTDLYGTSGFKRRRIRPATIAQGIAPTAGTTNGNLLNI